MLATFNRLFPKGSGRRTSLFSIGTFVILLALTRVRAVFPKSTPFGVYIFAMIGGAQTALIAASLIIVYRASRVINFAAGALGTAGSAMMFNLAALLDWPFVFALLAGILTSLILGIVADAAFIQRFFNAPRLVLTVVTIVMTSLLGLFSQYVDKIPGMPDKTDPILARKIQTGKIPLPFENFSFEIFPFRFGFAHIFTMGLVFLAFGGLYYFLRRTKMGAQIRGTSENADRAVTLGVNVRMLSTVSWAVAALLSGFAAITAGMTLSFASAAEVRPEALLPALAAAVLGKMRNLPLTIFAAFGIDVLTQAVSWSYPQATIIDLVMLAIIFVGLLVQRKTMLRGDDDTVSSWEAAKEIRPTPKEMTAVSGIRRMRRALMGLGLLSLVVFPLATSPAQNNLAGLIAIQAIIAMSLVVLTGWGGQVSLGQFALVAVAAIVGGKLTSEVHLPFVVALPLVMVITGGFAALVGLPALRIKGSFLAVTTLAFAVAVQSTLFNETYFGWLIPDRVERPRFLFLSFGSERNYYYLTVFCTILAAVAVKRLRASRPGRVLLAVREDERGVQAFGINLIRTKIAVFGLSGALAGLAGMLFVHHQRAIDAQSYSGQESIEMFLMAMIGGITSVSGAILGAAYLGIVKFFITSPPLRQLSTSMGLMMLLFVSPGGLAALVYQGRDGILRIIAARRQLVVPSLFENFDPEAVARRKIPFGPMSQGEGLDAIPPGRRYELPSELYPRSLERGAPLPPSALRPALPLALIQTETGK